MCVQSPEQAVSITEKIIAKHEVVLKIGMLMNWFLLIIFLLCLILKESNFSLLRRLGSGCRDNMIARGLDISDLYALNFRYWRIQPSQRYDFCPACPRRGYICSGTGVLLERLSMNNEMVRIIQVHVIKAMSGALATDRIMAGFALDIVNKHEQEIDCVNLNLIINTWLVSSLGLDWGRHALLS